MHHCRMTVAVYCIPQFNLNQSKFVTTLQKICHATNKNVRGKSALIKEDRKKKQHVIRISPLRRAPYLNFKTK